MRTLFLLFLLLSIPQIGFAKLTNPSPLPVPDASIGERSAKVEWAWEIVCGNNSCEEGEDKKVGTDPVTGKDIVKCPEDCEGVGTVDTWLAKFIIDGGPKRDILGNPVARCEDIGDWFKIHEEPGKTDRAKNIKGLEKGETYCWRVMAQAEDTKDNSDIVPGPEFKTKKLVAGAVCGNNSCEAGEDPVSCPKDCKVGGSSPIIGSDDLNPISAKNLTQLFNKIFSFLFGLSIFLVPVFVIYAAFLMLMGGGDPIKLQKGRMILLWTAIAFIIILLSRGLPVVFKNLL